MTPEELKKYLEAQIELGESEIFFDEPWVMQKNVPIKPTFAKAIIPETKTVITPVGQNEPVTKNEPIFTQIKQTPIIQENPFAKAISLDELYVHLANHPIYQGKKIHRELFAENPKILILLDFPFKEESSLNSWKESPVGQMLTRLFSALSITPDECGFSYVYKALSDRAPSPLLDLTLRQSLAKEISFVKPKTLVVFGELPMRQLFGRDKSLRQLAGVPQKFEDIPTVCLHDARAMLSNVNLKKETWSLHIPKCGFFK